MKSVYVHAAPDNVTTEAEVLNVLWFSLFPRVGLPHHKKHFKLLTLLCSLLIVSKIAENGMARVTAAFRVKLSRLLDSSYLGEIQDQASGVLSDMFFVVFFLG